MPNSGVGPPAAAPDEIVEILLRLAISADGIIPHILSPHIAEVSGELELGHEVEEGGELSDNSLSFDLGPGR